MSDWHDVSVLIVGCGSIGKRHARVLAVLGVRDVRACDPVESQCQALQAETPSVRLYESFEAGLASEPATVLLGTPPKLHLPQAMQAIRAGCHVFSEKPLSDSTQGIDELEALAHAADKKVAVGLCFRHHEGLVKAKSYLDCGRIGRLVSVRALMGEPLPEVRPDYRNLFSAQYMGALDLVHDIDLAIWYVGQPLRRVCCLGGSYSDIGISAPDIVEILMEFEGRCLASVHLDFFQRPRRRQIEMLGTEGVIIVEFARWEHCTVSVYEAAKRAWSHEDIATQRDDMFRAEDREFLQAVAEEKPVHYGIAEARQSVVVVEQCLEAINRQQA